MPGQGPRSSRTWGMLGLLLGYCTLFCVYFVGWVCGWGGANIHPAGTACARDGDLGLCGWGHRLDENGVCIMDTSEPQ